MFGRTSHNELRDRELPMPATFARRFLLEEAMSAGHPTFVWRAEEMATRRRVALTFFPATWLDSPQDMAGAKELVAAMQVLSHPGVVVPSEVVAGEPWSAFVSSWIDGPTLHQMRAGRPGRCFEVDEFRPWLLTLVAALETVHARGFVHGGLNPGLVIQRGARLCIVNTGVCAWLERAVERHDGRSRSGSFWPYRSPSQRRGEPAGAADDIYALGAILFEQLTGMCPGQGLGSSGSLRPGFIEKQRRGTGTPGKDVPVSWESAIGRCLEPRARNRLGSVGELRVRLDLAAPDRGPMPAASAAPPAPRPPASAVPAATIPVRPPMNESAQRSREVGTWGLRCMVALIMLATIAVAAALIWQLMAQRSAVPAMRPDPAGLSSSDP